MKREIAPGSAGPVSSFDIGRNNGEKDVKQIAFKAFRRLVRVLSAFERPLARLPLVPRIYHAAYKRVKPKGLIQVAVEGASLWMNADDEGIARPLLLKGTFEEDETALVKRLLQPGMQVADIGANVGYYTVLTSRLVGPSGRVFAFEPAPKNFELLLKNLETNGCRNVRPFQVALSSQSGTGTLYLDGSATGNPSMSGDNVPDKAGEVQVQTVTLDEALSGEAPIDFLKIDVQGAEGHVLRGAQRVLAQAKLAILIEIWPAGLRNLQTDPGALLQSLVERGFRMDVVRTGGQRRRLGSVEEALALSEDGFVNLLLEK